MSARHLQASKPIPSAEYKSVGAIIVTTLAFDKVPDQSTNLFASDTKQGLYDSEGAGRPAQQDGSAITASTSRPEGSNPPHQDLRETSTLEENPLTNAFMWVCHNLVPMNDRKGPQERTPTLWEIKFAEHKESVLARRPMDREPELSDFIDLFYGYDILREFERAAPRQLEGEDASSEKSMQLHVPPFLHPVNRVRKPRYSDIEDVMKKLRISNEGTRAFNILCKRFSPEEFEKNFYCSVRKEILEAGSWFWRKDVTPLASYYAEGVQKWCASIFDATVRRIKFVIGSNSGQSWNEGEKLKDKLLKEHDWLATYLQAEPNLREAVDKIKKKLDEEDLQSWIEYEEKHALNSTDKMNQPFRSIVHLSQDTHFISWYLRRPKFLLGKRGPIIEAIKAIEGESSILVDVLENLCVQDLDAFEKTRERIMGEKFQRSITVPQD
eukprot:Blabericola_migrator_1__6167@NODE_3110_length_2030_cov_20_779929_g1947_i0_p1_GENE_NODE_3110_length_2030_cov_20_779929_g1947_i0NODE_3110_length_2030_cov_20_779929_g1947_i0_p1_ORF_typecomplete_len439_score67_97GldM_N/PF12081_8/0_18GldM_N/PF12081_8/9_6e03_NODE_3110_length_2030_cov_20_779929_g1947_i01971513